MSKTLTLSLDPGAIAAASLERRARLQTAILDSMADAIVVSDHEGATYANPAAGRLFGRAFPVGWTILLADGRSVCPPENHPLPRATRGESFDEELCMIRPNGATIWVSASGRALMADGTARGGVVVFRDVTEKREMERRLLLTDRMAALGTLAAGVAHEVNNPLSFLLANLDYSVEELSRAGGRTEVIDALKQALEGAHRVRKIVADLRTLSSGNDAPTRVDVVKTVDVALGITAAALRARARVVREVSGVPGVIANEARLAQVFVNLLANAAQAIPAGAPEKHEIRVKVGLDDRDGRVFVEIRDTGVGIAPGVLPQIFDPFYTTKPVGEGTGLGLSITHGIVTALKGEIVVTSQPGIGSCFRVLLPVEPTVSVRISSPPVAAGKQRILVVDDEPALLDTVRRILAPDFDVVTETNATFALDRLSCGERFSAILCDVRMPNMSGAEFIEEVRRLVPSEAKRIVIVSGSLDPGKDPVFKDVRVVPKPFDRKALREAIAAVSG